MTDDETHGARIRRLRKEKKWTQEDLEEAAKVDQSTLSGIEKRGAMPSGDTLVRLARALGTSAEYVLTGEDPLWPFASIPMRRFMALSARDRLLVEGELAGAIKDRENAQQLDTAQQQTDPAVAATKQTPSGSRARTKGVKLGAGNGSKAGGKQPGGVQKPGRGGNS